MSILDTVKDWLEGKQTDQAPARASYKTGQESYLPQPVPVDIQHQVISTELKPIPVDIAGMVPVWNLPSKRQSIHQTGAYGVAPNVLVDGSYKIKRLTVWAPFTGFYIGSEADMRRPGYGMAVTLPQWVPIVMEGVSDSLWFAQSQASVTANGVAGLNYIAEYWLD